MDVHLPYEPPAPFRALYATARPDLTPLRQNGPADFDDETVDYSRAMYDAQINYWDDRFRDLIETMESAGQLENTVVVVVADHGEEFGEHAGFGHGFTAYRGVGPAWHHRLPGLGRKVARTFENLAPFPPLTSRPTKEGALWNLPASSLYLHREGWRRKAPIALRVLRAKAGLTRAAREGSSFHLWFHPFNLASEPEGLLSGLESIFKEVARLREAGHLINPTMTEMADMLELATNERETAA